MSTALDLPPSSRPRILFVSAAALLVRAGYVFSMVKLYGAEQTSDFFFMDRLAQSLAAGNGFTLAGERIFNQSIGYPAVLAVLYRMLGSDTHLGLALNAVLGGVSTGLVYLLTWSLLRDPIPGLPWLRRERAALLAAGLLAIYPDSLMYASVLASENLLIPILLATFLAAAWRTRKDWQAGALTGALAAAAASTKAQVLFGFVLIPLLWRAAGARVVRRTAAAVVAAGVVLAPWTYLNYRDSGGYFVPFSAIAGEVFLDGTNPLALGTTSNVYSLGPEVEAGHSKIEVDRMKLVRAIEYIKADPVWYLKLEIQKLLRSVSPIRDFMFEDSGKYRLFTPLISRWVPTLFNTMLGIGLLAGCIVWWRVPRARATALTLLVGMFAVQLVFIGYSRYRLPYLVCLLPFVSVGLLSLYRRLVRPPRSPSHRGDFSKGVVEV